MEDSLTLFASRGGVIQGDVYRALHMPRAQVTLAAVASIANVAPSAITFDTPIYNEDSMWAVSAGSLLTARTPGLYWVSANFAWAPSAGGTLRWTYLLKNGVGPHLGDDARGPAGANIVWCNSADYISLNAGDYVQLVAYQDTGGALATTVAVGPSAKISMCFDSTIG